MVERVLEVVVVGVRMRSACLVASLVTLAGALQSSVKTCANRRALSREAPVGRIFYVIPWNTASSSSIMMTTDNSAFLRQTLSAAGPLAMSSEPERELIVLNAAYDQCQRITE